MKQDHRHLELDLPARNERRIFWAALLTAGFMVAEVVGGLLTGSLALIADAAHMLADAVALGLAWVAFRLARQRGPSARLTYGLRRLPVLVAFANGLALFFIVGWILVEAMARLAVPVTVLAGPMLAVAATGLFVNLGSLALLRGTDRGNLNIRGALLHVLGDLLGSVAAIVAAGIILKTGWYPADPLLSVLVAAIVAVGAFRLARDSAHILLEGVPEGVDVAAIGADLAGHVPGVEEVHHIHIWSLSQEGVMATLHARIAETADGDEVLDAICDRLDAEFGIGHATIQIEREGC
ncbi:MAG: cation diffusion facilitator family transporter [Hyphomicrobiales bacterium]|nr:cation diffusion facilitator family transporter [Hyphomicrobiales bacterium]